MADESINSSPQKSNRSIHSSRLHRKTKRLNATFSKPAEVISSNQRTISSNEETFHDDLSCTLLVMYDSEKYEEVDASRNLIEKPLLRVSANYDPFAEQRMLHLADRFTPPPRNSTSFVATQRFEPCNNLLFQQTEFPTKASTISRSSNKYVFDVTDSELLQVCEETEKKSVKSNIGQETTEYKKEPTTPDSTQRPKSIVDIILEDFCSSPASPEPQQSSGESSFHFRFANKPLRTYSRRRHEDTLARKNIAEQYVQTAEIEQRCAIDDDVLSNDSDLSVQEDHTQIRQAADAKVVVNLQHSQKLCENLQNLSAYFSELSEEIDKKAETCKDVSQELVDTSNQNWAKSANESLDTYCTAIKKIESNNYPRDELEDLNEMQKQCFTSHSGHISAEEDFKGFPSEHQNTPVDMKPAPDKNCDILKNQVHELDSLNEDDEWNDECDFFANFDMEVALDAVSTSKLDKNNSDELLCQMGFHTESTAGFRTASNKTVVISAEAKVLANEILQELPPLPTNTSCTEDFIMNDEKEDYQHPVNQTMTISKHITKNNVERTPDSPMERSIGNPTKPSTSLYDEVITNNNEAPSFVGFCTASNRKITISKEAQQRGAKILENLPPLQREHASLSDASASKESFVGFRTASCKEIKISKEAQERASKILEQLPELNVVEGVEPNNEVTTNAPTNSITCAGFRTASSKVIRISEEAKRRAAMIMQYKIDENVEHIQEECLRNMQFSEWPVDGEEAQIELNARSTANEGERNVHDFRFLTESIKPILMSEEAKPKTTVIENISKLTDSVPSAARSKIPGNAFEAEPLESVVFSEWPLADAGDVFEDAQDYHSIGSNKRKREDIDLVPNGEESSSSPQHTPKLICKTVSFQRSPLAHIQQSATCSSLRELALKTPPDYRSSRGIISRKNLLSLNKRKSNAKTLQQPKELKDSNVCTKTPTKKNNTAEPKSPPVTPNLREFFTSACVSTSTPHLPLRQETRIQTRARKRTELEAAATTATETTTPTKGASLKRIEWNNETLNKSTSSLNASRLFNSSCSNITKLESKPTPKQRIERLRMYGKPPSLSPIYMSSTNNCRISGLKRHSRSATKEKQLS